MLSLHGISETARPGGLVGMGGSALQLICRSIGDHGPFQRYPRNANEIGNVIQVLLRVRLKVAKKGYQYIFAAQIVKPAFEMKGIAIGAEQISRPFYPFTVMFKRLQKCLSRDPSFRSQ